MPSYTYSARSAGQWLQPICRLHIRFPDKIDILLYRIGASIFHKVTELGFGNAKSFHAVIVKDGQIDLYELIPNQDAGDGRTYTLLPETCHRSIEISAFFKLMPPTVTSSNSLKRRRVPSRALVVWSIMARISFGIHRIVRRRDRVELVCIGIGGFDNQLGTVAFFLFLSYFG